MILPSDEECQRIVKELADEESLTEWEAEFIDSNRGRGHFTDKQKEIFARLKEKFVV